MYNWTLYFTSAGKVFKDVSFVNPQVGYIVTELGAVFKTTNGGINWVTKLNLGFPYYWYGVFALTPDTVIISGFNDQGNIYSGVVRWSYNGGTTWTSDINLYLTGGVGWLDRVHFFNQNTGVVMAATSGGLHYTTNGGKDSTGWTYVQINSDLGWFAGSVDFQSSGNIYASGIHFAHSTNFGLNWATFPPADAVFDGGTDFLDYNNLYGWTGGGSISPTVAGWVHRTTDGGTTWSDRLNTFSYPIRALRFFNTNTGFISGGNVYSEAGWIYSTTNGGLNWNLDVNTAAEMFSINTVNVGSDSMDVWCVGSTGGATGYNGKAYKTRIGNPATGIKNVSSVTPSNYFLYQNYPNPFNPTTVIRFQISNPENGILKTGISPVVLKVYNILGKEVATLVNEKLVPGVYEVPFSINQISLNQIPSGIYFYKLQTNDFSSVKKMMLVK
jgi:photosystem II stability/assembly factor-like uncharacterized protein